MKIIINFIVYNIVEIIRQIIRDVGLISPTMNRCSANNNYYCASILPLFHPNSLRERKLETYTYHKIPFHAPHGTCSGSAQTCMDMPGINVSTRSSALLIVLPLMSYIPEKSTGLIGTLLNNVEPTQLCDLNLIGIHKRPAAAASIHKPNHVDGIPSLLFGPVNHKYRYE